MSFLETPEFPDPLTFGTVGGPEYNTSVITMASGHEQRNQNWAYPRHRYNAAPAVKTASDAATLLAFFHAVRGQADGFRFHDRSDDSATDQALTLTGGPTVQLVKTYTAGANTLTRTIAKPVSGAAFEHNSSSYGGASVDTTTGVVTLTASATASITDITQANPGQVEAVGHGYNTGDEIYLSGVGGMTELNGTVVAITVVDPDNFTIGIDTTGYTAYTSGGDADRYPQSSDTFTWTGNFRVPVRFATDWLARSIDNYGDDWILAVQDIPLVEVRL